jgi:hypothetical protein
MLCTPLAPTAADAAASLTDLLAAEAEAGPLPGPPCACTNAAVQWMHEVREQKTEKRRGDAIRARARKVSVAPALLSPRSALPGTQLSRKGVAR